MFRVEGQQGVATVGIPIVKASVDEAEFACIPVEGVCEGKYGFIQLIVGGFIDLIEDNFIFMIDFVKDVFGCGLILERHVFSLKMCMLYMSSLMFSL